MKFLIYNIPGEEASVSVVVKDETIWLTQKAMAELFGVGVPAISKHLKNIFEEGELMEEVVISILETTTEHGAIAGKTQTNLTKFYNLDAIISVGYRVSSRKATNFRIWATGILKEYMTKGFVMDDERMKQGKTAFGKDYFRELLERVRASEEYGCKSPTSLPSAALIMIKRPISRKSFMLWCRISFIMLLPARLLRKL